jgi:hypothetical protein
VQVGQLYRLSVRVPAGYVAQVRRAHGDSGQKALLADVEARVRHLGYAATLLAVQDPTTPGQISVLARPALAAPATTDGVVQITDAVATEEPSPTPTGKGAIALDSGMSADDAQAFTDTFFQNQNARHLDGLATTFLPWFPVSAALLRGKAGLIEKRVPMTPAASTDLFRAATAPAAAISAVQLPAAKAAFDAYAARQPLPLPVIRDDVRKAIAASLGAGAGTFPSPVANLAKATIRYVPFAGSLVAVPLPDLVARALPPHPDDGFVSPSALQLALAMQKPDWSRVGQRARIGAAAGQMDRPGVDPVQAARARHQMERATSAIDRRRWIEWSRRTRLAGTETL